MKKKYAVDSQEMYCTCVFFYLCVNHIWTRTVTELPTVKRFMIECNLFHYWIEQYLMQVIFFYDLTMTTNDLKMS